MDYSSQKDLGEGGERSSIFPGWYSFPLSFAERCQSEHILGAGHAADRAEVSSTPPEPRENELDSFELGLRYHHSELHAAPT